MTGEGKPAKRPDRIYKGQKLKPGEGLDSANGNWRLEFQTDGMMAVFDQNNNLDWWKPFPADGSAYLTIDPYGDFSLLAGGKTIWRADTSGATYAVMQDDGDLAVYLEYDSKHIRLWSMNKSRGGRG